MKLYIPIFSCLIMFGAYTGIQAAEQNSKKPASKKSCFINFSKKSKKKKTLLAPSTQPSSSTDQPASSTDIPATTGPEVLNRKLRIAIHADNVCEVERLLSLGADANYFQTFQAPDEYHDPVNCTPLAYAAECANPAIISLLLAAGAKANPTHSDTNAMNTGLTPLQAIIFNYYRQHPIQLCQNVDLLIKAGADASISAKGLIESYPVPVTHMLDQIAVADLPNRYVFPIIKALFKGGIQKNMPIIETVLEHADVIVNAYRRQGTSQKTDMLIARAAFLKQYPGDTLQERVLLDLLVRSRSDDEIVATAAQSEISFLESKYPNFIAFLQPFIHDARTTEFPAQHSNPDPFLRENFAGQIRFNTPDVMLWDDSLDKKKRRFPFLKIR